MANGIEDLREKNKGREKPTNDRRYLGWSSHYGREDSEMLMEKAHSWSSGKKGKDYHYYDD